MGEDEGRGSEGRVKEKWRGEVGKEVKGKGRVNWEGVRGKT